MSVNNNMNIKNTDIQRLLQKFGNNKSAKSAESQRAEKMNTSIFGKSQAKMSGISGTTASRMKDIADSKLHQNESAIQRSVHSQGARNVETTVINYSDLSLYSKEELETIAQDLQTELNGDIPRSIEFKLKSNLSKVTAEQEKRTGETDSADNSNNSVNGESNNKKATEGSSFYTPDLVGALRAASDGTKSNSEQVKSKKEMDNLDQQMKAKNTETEKENESFIKNLKLAEKEKKQVEKQEKAEQKKIQQEQKNIEALSEDITSISSDMEINEDMTEDEVKDIENQTTSEIDERQAEIQKSSKKLRTSNSNIKSNAKSGTKATTRATNTSSNARTINRNNNATIVASNQQTSQSQDISNKGSALSSVVTVTGTAATAVGGVLAAIPATHVAGEITMAAGAAATNTGSLLGKSSEQNAASVTKTNNSIGGVAATTRGTGRIADSGKKQAASMNKSLKAGQARSVKTLTNAKKSVNTANTNVGDSKSDVNNAALQNMQNTQPKQTEPQNEQNNINNQQQDQNINNKQNIDNKENNQQAANNNTTPNNQDSTIKSNILNARNEQQSVQEQNSQNKENTGSIQQNGNAKKSGKPQQNNKTQNFSVNQNNTMTNPMPSHSQTPNINPIKKQMLS